MAIEESLVSDNSLDHFLELNELSNLVSRLLIDVCQRVHDSQHVARKHYCIGDDVHPRDWMECVK